FVHAAESGASFRVHSERGYFAKRKAAIEESVRDGYREIPPEDVALEVGAAVARASGLFIPGHATRRGRLAILALCFARALLDERHLGETFARLPRWLRSARVPE